MTYKIKEMEAKVRKGAGRLFMEQDSRGWVATGIDR